MNLHIVCQCGLTLNDSHIKFMLCKKNNPTMTNKVILDKLKLKLNCCRIRVMTYPPLSESNVKKYIDETNDSNGYFKLSR